MCFWRHIEPPLYRHNYHQIPRNGNASIEKNEKHPICCMPSKTVSTLTLGGWRRCSGRLLWHPGQEQWNPGWKGMVLVSAWDMFLGICSFHSPWYHDVLRFGPLLYLEFASFFHTSGGTWGMLGNLFKIVSQCFSTINEKPHRWTVNPHNSLGTKTSSTVSPCVFCPVLPVLPRDNCQFQDAQNMEFLRRPQLSKGEKKLSNLWCLFFLHGRGFHLIPIFFAQHLMSICILCIYGKVIWLCFTETNRVRNHSDMASERTDVPVKWYWVLWIFELESSSPLDTLEMFEMYSLLKPSCCTKEKAGKSSQL